MRILVLGGSGRTGTLVIDEALSRGHTVTALARGPDSISARNGLTITQGTPLEATDIDKAFNATPNDTPASVIITLNARRASDNPFSQPIAPPRFMANSCANAVSAMKKYGVRKIVIMQAHGVGDSFPSLFFAMRWVVKRSNMSASYEDHNLVDQETKKSDLQYVLARPTRLTQEEAKPLKFYGNTGEGIGSFDSISRKSVAGFLVDAAEKNDWDRMTPVIAN